MKSANAPGGVLGDGLRHHPAAGVLDALEGDAEPGEEAVVLADVRGELAVDDLDRRKVEVPLLQLAPDRLRAVVEDAGGGGGRGRCRWEAAAGGRRRSRRASGRDEAVVGRAPRRGAARPRCRGWRARGRSGRAAGSARRRWRRRRSCASARAGCRRGRRRERLRDHAGAATDAVEAVDAAVERLQPEGAVLALAVAVAVHAAEPAGQLVLGDAARRRGCRPSPPAPPRSWCLRAACAPASGARPSAFSSFGSAS